MKKQWIYGAVTGILTAALITGCGDGSGGSARDIYSEALEPVALIGTSEPEAEQAVGEPDGTEASMQGDNGIQSSAAEDSGTEMEAAVRENLKNLKQNLELPEYMGEAIHLVSSDEWFAAVAGGLYEGCRSYTLGGEEASLSVQVGYDIEEKPYVNACYQVEDRILVLKYARNVVWLLQTGIAGDVCNGAFEKWQIDGGAGHILKETGTYANGIVVGNYTKAEYTGNGGELFDLWTNRENFAYKTTNLTYNDQGEIAAAPSATPVATQKPDATKKPPQTSAPTPVPTSAPRPTEAPPQATAEPPQPTEAPPQPTEAPPQPTEAPPQPTEAPPQPTEAPTPDPVPEPTEAPQGGDTDIEWSPDMM